MTFNLAMYLGILISTLCFSTLSAFIATNDACNEDLRSMAPNCHFDTVIFNDINNVKADVVKLQRDFAYMQYQTIKQLELEIHSLSVRLNGNDDRGVAEVYDRGHWGAICNRFWDNDDANVFCKSLGFYKGIVSNIGRTTRPYIMSDVDCSSTEKSVFDCQYVSHPLESKCANNQAASVKCDINIRLNGSNFDNKRGRVEITHLEQWGTICDEHWSNEDATVVCRMLGFYNGGIAVSDATFGTGNSLVWLTNVTCTGTENTLLDCKRSSFGQHTCTHPHDASVVCN